MEPSEENKWGTPCAPIALADTRDAARKDREARARAASAREELRRRALTALTAGASVSAVARTAGVPRSTIYIWLGRRRGAAATGSGD